MEIQRDIKAARASSYASASGSKKRGGEVHEMEVEIRGRDFDFRLEKQMSP